MLKRLFQSKIKPSSVHILAVIFVCFIFYVGLVPFSQFTGLTKQVLQGQLSPRDYIKQTNDQYDHMLETFADYKLLQNKGTYINLNGLMAKLLRQPMVNNQLLLKNGHLASVTSKSPDPEEIRQAADHIIRFHDDHSASGGRFLFVMVPSQVSKYEDLLPAGFCDTANDTADQFLALLDEAGVPYLDLREELHEDGISITDAYFATDHHWTPQTGFWAYGKILKKMEQMDIIGPVDSFYTDPSNYRFETYSDSFLGSSGRRTGIYFAGLDDSILIRPNFETDISIRIPKRNLELRGRYEDVSYSNDVQYDYDHPDFYQENLYGLYGWGDTPITHWRNEQAPEEGRFLLIGESFGNIPFGLMSIYLSSCDEVDLRHFTDDFPGYYRDYDPDTVIVEINITAVLSEFTEFTYLE